jgi:uncharacterized protein YciI
MLFSILIYDEPDSASLRDEYRQAHLDYLEAFDPQTMFAGPFTTDDESADLGSLRLIEFPDRAAAEKHIADEPYVIGGVQKRWQIHRWRNSLPYTWRDCPREAGNIQALFYAVDHPDGADKRTLHQDAHDAFVKDHADSVMMHGPLLDDAGDGPMGDVFLLDVPDLDTGRAMMDGEPYCQSGLYAEKMFHRWRFGRVFDRFKV